MTFFDDTSTDSSRSRSDPPQLNPDTYDPDRIEIGVAATPRPDGGVALDYITYVDGMPTPTYDDMLVGEPWVAWDETRSSGCSDSPPPRPQNTQADDRPPVEEICEERKGWAVIRSPDSPDEWVAMPIEEAITDLRKCQ